MTPPPSGTYTEDASVEKPAIDLFKELAWKHIDAYHEVLGEGGRSAARVDRRSSWSVRSARPLNG